MAYTLKDQAAVMNAKQLDYINSDNGLALYAYDDGIWLVAHNGECDMSLATKIERIADCWMCPEVLTVTEEKTDMDSRLDFLNGRIARNHTTLQDMADDVNAYLSEYRCSFDEYLDRRNRIIADSTKCEHEINSILGV